MKESGYLRPMWQPGQTLLHPASTFFHFHLCLLSAGALACYTPKTQNCLSPTGNGSLLVILIKDIRHPLASINRLPKEEGTMYIMSDRLFYICLTD